MSATPSTPAALRRVEAAGELVDTALRVLDAAHEELARVRNASDLYDTVGEMTLMASQLRRALRLALARDGMSLDGEPPGGGK